jgi:hypothetical protein
MKHNFPKHRIYSALIPFSIAPKPCKYISVKRGTFDLRSRLRFKANLYSLFFGLKVFRMPGPKFFKFFFCQYRAIGKISILESLYFSNPFRG